MHPRELMREATEKCTKGGLEIQDNLQKYFANQDRLNNVRVKDREEFFARANTLRRQTIEAVKTQLQGAIDMKLGMSEIDQVKKAIKRKVQDLLQDKTPHTGDILKKEFQTMWAKCLSEIHPRPKRDIAADAYTLLRDNLSTRGAQ